MNKTLRVTTTHELLLSLQEYFVINDKLLSATVEWRLEDNHGGETCDIRMSKDKEKDVLEMKLDTVASIKFFHWMRERYELPLLGQNIFLSARAEEHAAMMQAQTLLVPRTEVNE